MSVWLYEIHRVEVSSGADFDDQIGKVLHDAGAHGWELVLSTTRHWHRRRQDPSHDI